jgi:hypothetical protein
MSTTQTFETVGWVMLLVKTREGEVPSQRLYATGHGTLSMDIEDAELFPDTGGPEASLPWEKGGCSRSRRVMRKYYVALKVRRVVNIVQKTEPL